MIVVQDTEIKKIKKDPLCRWQPKAASYRAGEDAGTFENSRPQIFRIPILPLLRLLHPLSAPHNPPHLLEIAMIKRRSNPSWTIDQRFSGAPSRILLDIATIPWPENFWNLLKMATMKKPFQPERFYGFSSSNFILLVLITITIVMMMIMIIIMVPQSPAPIINVLKSSKTEKSSYKSKTIKDLKTDKFRDVTERIHEKLPTSMKYENRCWRKLKFQSGL